MIIDRAEPEEEGFYLQLSKLFAVQGSRYESLNGDYGIHDCDNFDQDDHDDECNDDYDNDIDILTPS